MIITRRLVIHGRVQGVGYRNGMFLAAGRVGVTGWVRNRQDGTVEAVVQGVPSAIEQIIDWAKRGPTAASVSHVECFEEEGMETYVSFIQRPTT